MLQNFMGFDGRIGRQSWWIGFIIIVIAYILLTFILGAIMGTSMFSMMSNPEAAMQPGAMESMMKTTSWLGLIILAIIIYPATALTAKRLNDRDQPSWLKWLLWVPAVISALLNVAGLGFTMTDVAGVQMPTPSTISYVFSILSLIALIWWIVDCGFLRGTQGQNQHGPDPVAE